MGVTEIYFLNNTLDFMFWFVFFKIFVLKKRNTDQFEYKSAGQPFVRSGVLVKHSLDVWTKN